MPVETVIGDLFTSLETVRLHGCNARGSFGSGIAGQMNRYHPEARVAYMLAFDEGRVRLGSIVWARSNTHRIANAITQDDFGRVKGVRYADYEAIRSCMRRLEVTVLRSHAEDRVREWFGGEVRRVAMPRIGAGLAGGDWEVIEAIIAEEARSFTAVIYAPPPSTGS